MPFLKVYCPTDTPAAKVWPTCAAQNAFRAKTQAGSAANTNLRKKFGRDLKFGVSTSSIQQLQQQQ